MATKKKLCNRIVDLWKHWSSCRPVWFFIITFNNYCLPNKYHFLIYHLTVVFYYSRYFSQVENDSSQSKKKTNHFLFLPRFYYFHILCVVFFAFHIFEVSLAVRMDQNYLSRKRRISHCIECEQDPPPLPDWLSFVPSGKKEIASDWINPNRTSRIPFVTVVMRMMLVRLRWFGGGGEVMKAASRPPCTPHCSTSLADFNRNFSLLQKQKHKYDLSLHQIYCKISLISFGYFPLLRLISKVDLQKYFCQVFFL